LPEIEIAGRRVGPGHPCFVIAEAGVNHNGDPEMAKRLIDVAVEAGADAVKFQTFKAEYVISPEAPKAGYQMESTDAGESQLDMVRKLELSHDDFRQLEAYCQESEIIFISTPFDLPSADFLDELGVPVFKIPSGETINLPLLRRIGSKGKPVILSTGMSTLEEVEQAIDTIKQTGNDQMVVLHCVSNYPAEAAEANLNAMRTMSDAFQTPVGFSDHTLGLEIPIAAVALGACVIEKHFTLDKELPGPDHRASLDPSELVAMVKAIRNVESAMGSGIKAPTESEKNNRNAVRRSLYLDADLATGATLGDGDLIALRPSGGIATDQIDSVVGRRLVRPLTKGARLSWDDLE